VKHFESHSLVLRRALALVTLLSSCTRQVVVDDPGADLTVTEPRGAISAGEAGSAPPPARAGSPANSPIGGSAAEPGMAGSGAAASDGGSTAGNPVMDGIDQAGAMSDSAIADIQVLALFLSAVEVPAVGSDGVSLTQYSGPDAAAILHVDWNGVPAWRHDASRAHYIYTAASTTHHLGLLHEASSYGIHEGGAAAELSGSPASYKEYLAANTEGFAWVDYPRQALGGPQRPSGDEPYGQIVFQTWSGARSTLSDALRYRARLDLSETHVAFVEYADAAAGSAGQIVVQAISGGAPIAVAPSEHHQDRPAIDGDWVVWEEYRSPEDSVIRARNLASGEVRDLSASTGFRTNPDVRGARVIWEDQRSGVGDIYFNELDADEGERIAVSGAGHSAAARLSFDGLVWIETAAGQIALLHARWIR
jgi:hypothetical protein